MFILWKEHREFRASSLLHKLRCEITWSFLFNLRLCKESYPENARLSPQLLPLVRRMLVIIAYRLRAFHTAGSLSRTSLALFLGISSGVSGTFFVSSKSRLPGLREYL